MSGNKKPPETNSRMRVLVLGAGVIGSTYGWQLSVSGHEVTHWVRDETKAARIAAEGLRLHCLDLRNRKPVEGSFTYRPNAVSDLVSGEWELIIVSVKCQQLAGLIPMLRDRFGRGTILFLQNLRFGDDELIAEQLDPERFIIGYPFKAGGGRDESGIQTVIFGGFFTHTMLGRPDGRITSTLRRIARALGDAMMAPRVTRRIVPYVRTHYVWAAASVGAYLEAGSFEQFLSPAIQRTAYVAMREGWEICRRQGIHPLSVTPTRYFYLPLFLLVPLTRRMYSNEGMRRMFEGHITHAPDEMKMMLDDMVRLGDEYGLSMPHLRRLCSSNRDDSD